MFVYNQMYLVSFVFVYLFYGISTPYGLYASTRIYQAKSNAAVKERSVDTPCFFFFFSLFYINKKDLHFQTIYIYIYDKPNYSFIYNKIQTILFFEFLCLYTIESIFFLINLHQDADKKIFDMF